MCASRSRSNNEQALRVRSGSGWAEMSSSALGSLVGKFEFEGKGNQSGREGAVGF